MEEILLPTDFSDEARAAYPAAVSLARQYGGRIRLVHQIDPPPTWYRTTEVEICLDDIYGRAQAELAAEAGRREFDGVPVEEELLHEETPQTTVPELARARRPDLIVMATHGRTGWKRLFLGSFADRVVRYSPVPVLIVRGDQEFSPRKILVPIDFSEAAASVYPAARSFAEGYGATLEFFKVLDPGDFYFYGLTSQDAVDAQIEQAHKVTTAARAEFEAIQAREFSNLDVAFDCTQGPPAREIARRAETTEADLVLLSTHGRTGAPRVLLGSVAEKVVRSAPCSVLVVPSKAETGIFSGGRRLHGEKVES